MNQRNVAPPADTSGRPTPCVEHEIAQVLGDAFGETDPDRIRRRRINKQLEMACRHLRGAVDVVTARGKREMCREHLTNAATWFNAALPSMEIALGVPVADRYCARLRGTLTRIHRVWEVESRGRCGGRVVTSVVPFHAGGTFPLWRTFLDQHGEKVVAELERAATGLGRLMGDVLPEPGPRAENPPRQELPFDGYSNKDVVRLLRRSGLHDLKPSALKQRMYRAVRALPKEPKSGLTRALLGGWCGSNTPSDATGNVRRRRSFWT